MAGEIPVSGRLARTDGFPANKTSIVTKGCVEVLMDLMEGRDVPCLFHDGAIVTKVEVMYQRGTGLGRGPEQLSERVVT